MPHANANSALLSLITGTNIKSNIFFSSEMKEYGATIERGIYVDIDLLLAIFAQKDSPRLIPCSLSVHYPTIFYVHAKSLGERTLD